MTLRDFLNVTDNAIVFYRSAGSPTGASVANVPEWYDLPINGAEGLDGTVGEDGAWQWDGIGHATDCAGNTITRLEAYSDWVEYQWQQDEYGSEVAQ